MDKVWEELYTEACRLQGEKKLSRYMRVGSVAAALILMEMYIRDSVLLIRVQ